MVRITEELLRRRSEHNEGCLSTLEEITLHQFDIEKIELVGEVCRKLKILYLQHNLIEKIENLHHLKQLNYLNLAINSIRKIENLEPCEDLSKLDLTVNCVDDLLSVQSLKGNIFLRELHLTGNPCTTYEGYRGFVIQSLPQLKNLDGVDITRFERIKASQDYENTLKYLKENQQNWIDKNTRDMIESANKPKFNEEGKRLYGNDPISRKLAAKEVSKEDNKREGSDLNEKKNKKKKRMTYEEEVEKYGKVMQRNEGKWNFKFMNLSPDDEHENGKYVLDIPIGRYCLISQVNIDVKPTFIEVDVRGKKLVLRFDQEVSPSKADAERSRSTGNLKITIPKLVVKKKDDGDDIVDVKI